MLHSVSISPMEMMGEVRPPARLNTTIVLPSNPTSRWKRKFFNYLSQYIFVKYIYMDKNRGVIQTEIPKTFVTVGFTGS